MKTKKSIKSSEELELYLKLLHSIKYNLLFTSLFTNLKNKWFVCFQYFGELFHSSVAEWD